ncbi:MAG: hypothetical protein KDA96_24010, partial [Planctomycetaceae bacterium]|nr:hypothetical protein [Planctomycetaceae bacterium]
MLGILISAGLLGIIIAVMEEGDFPGWGTMTACVFAAILPTGIINAVLPPAWFLVGPVVGAVAGGFTISALCGMSVKRASIAAGIFLTLQIGP